jgi:serine protease inhibitor
MRTGKPHKINQIRSRRHTQDKAGRVMMMMKIFQRLLVVYSSSIVALSIMMIASAQEDLQKAQVAFADGVVEDLYTLDKNQCTSALGMSMMMSLLYPAMDDEARLQAQTVFGYPPDASGLVWEDVTADINSRNDGACIQPDNCDLGVNPLVSITNSVWVKEGATVNDTYATVLGNLTEAIDFAGDTAGKTINEWVSNATRGVIDKLVGT